MTSQCLWSNGWSNYRALKDRYLIARISAAIAQITLAIALMILATLVILISIRVFIISLMNSVSDVQEFKFLDFYTALILGGCATVFTSITVTTSDGFCPRTRPLWLAQKKRANSTLQLPYYQQQAGLVIPHLILAHDDKEENS